jgi:DNA-binding transcriptional MerR regulator
MRRNPSIFSRFLRISPTASLEGGGVMGALLSSQKLAESLGITLYKVRRYTKAGILTPMSKDRGDGKTLLYDPRCVEIKLEILYQLSVDYSQKELGERFKRVFGRRNAALIRALESMAHKEEIISKFLREIESPTT